MGVTSLVIGQLPKARISIQELVLASGRHGSDAQWGREEKEENTSPEWQQEIAHSPQQAGVFRPRPDAKQPCGVPLGHLRCPQAGASGCRRTSAPARLPPSEERRNPEVQAWNGEQPSKENNG